MENSPGGIVVSSAVGVGVVVTTLLLCYDFFVIGGPPVKIGASAVGILTIVQAVNAGAGADTLADKLPARPGARRAPRCRGALADTPLAPTVKAILED